METCGMFKTSAADYRLLLTLPAYYINSYVGANKTPFVSISIGENFDFDKFENLGI